MPSINAPAAAKAAESFLYIPATYTDKASWVKAARANRLTLAEWATQVLNKAAKREYGLSNPHQQK